MRKLNDDVYNYITYHKNVSVAELNSSFDISERTTRRILSQLESDGLIMRYHGGAHVLRSVDLSEELHRRKHQKNIIKMNIAKAAATLISDGDSIIMLGGTTVFALCEFIIGKNITVVTNSLAVVTKLYKFTNIKLLLFGGEINLEEMETMGLPMQSLPADIGIDSLFIGATSFSPAQGITTRDEMTIKQYNACAKISRNVYSVFDNSKFTRTKFPTAIATKDITAIITNKIDESVKRQLNQMGTNVFLSDNDGNLIK